MFRAAKKISQAILPTLCAALVLVGISSNSSLAANQKVTLFTNNSAQVAGGDFTITVNYDVTDKNNKLTGIDISIHFDSSKIEYKSCENFLDRGDIKSPPNILPDTLDEDKNPQTDKRIHMSWTSFSGTWPGVTLPAVLAKLNFSLRSNIDAGNTSVNVTVFDNAAGYGTVLRAANITVIQNK